MQDASAAPHCEWAGLPAPVLLRVFSFLSLQDLCVAGQVCWHWHAVTGSETLWSSILQHQFGRSLPLAASSSCRRCLLQLRTSVLWAAGSFTADSIQARPGDDADAPVRYSSMLVSSTELRQVWSAQRARQAAVVPLHGSSSSSSSSGSHILAHHTHGLPGGSSTAVAVAAGGKYVVAVGCDGSVLDTRGIFTEQAQHSPAVIDAEQQPPQQQQQQQQPPQQQQQQGQEVDLGQQWGRSIAAEIRAGHAINISNSWLPPAGAAIVSVSAGVGGHVLAVAADGRLWGWGSNDCGQLGLGSCSAWQHSPTDISGALDGAWKPEGERVVSVACGSAHSVVLLSGGGVVTAGCNSSGQCGQDLGLQQCPVFCEPHLAPDTPGAALSTNSSTTTTTSIQQHTGSGRTSTPALPDIAAAAAQPPKPLPLLPAAAAIAAGPSNTCVASASGRVLVAGSCGSGQCGAGWLKASGGISDGFVDVGPELSWHGLTRPSAAEVAAAGGTLAAALPKVLSVCVGEGTCYALTQCGEVFAWGQGSKGQLGTGGCPKVQATPAKLPWARQISSISASPTGQFAAAVDRGGKLYTWGAGKWGQLGHGDTSKRTVGRLVKQLRHLEVLQVLCCAESILVVTCQHSTHRQQQLLQQQHDPSHKQQQQQPPATSASPSSGQELNTPSCSKQQRKGQGQGQSEPGPMSPTTASSSADPHVGVSGSSSSSPADRAEAAGRQARKGRGRRQQHGWAAATASLELEAAPAAAVTAGAAAAAAAADLSDMRGVDWQDVEGAGPFFCPTPDTSRTPAAADSRHRQHRADLWEHEGRTSSSSSTRGSTRAEGSYSSSTGNDGGLGGSSSSSSSSQSSRHLRMDKGFKRLLRRLLTGFMADSKQREMTFPATLSAADRYQVHVAAEAWGLAHASHNQGTDRVIKVWKVSRTRRSPPIIDPDLGGDSDGE